MIGLITCPLVTFYLILAWPNVDETNRSLIIPRGCKRNQLKNKLKNEGYISNGTTFLWTAYLLKYHPKNKPGHYQLVGKMNNWQIVRMLRSGAQHPVRLTFSAATNLAGLVDQLVDPIGVSKEALWKILRDDRQLSCYGFTSENVLTLFIPDTYEVYWTINAEQLLLKMYLAYQNFWNQKRLSKAQEIGLSPIDVSILASIVQAETNDQEEAAIIAGVYLNRLKRNMRLDSDPMLIYALKKDQPNIRRVLQKDTYIDSPYNSYRRKGLPPGPIGLSSKAMIDAVLNYIPHNYLFFSAKEDFSGRHYFAQTYKEHLKNARKYTQALDKLKIMR